MPISFRCPPPCNKSIGVPDHLAGKKVKCPRCGMLTPVPGEPVAASSASAEPAGAPEMEAEVRIIAAEPPAYLRKQVLLPAVAGALALVVVLLLVLSGGGAKTGPAETPRPAAAAAQNDGPLVETPKPAPVTVTTPPPASATPAPPPAAPQTPAQPPPPVSPPPPAPPPAKAHIEVDNTWYRPWMIEVDGKPVGEIGGHEVGRFELLAGPHVVKVLLKGQLVSESKLDLPAGKVTVVNPQSRAAYFRIAPAKPAEAELIRGQESVVDDYGLTPGFRPASADAKILLRQCPEAFHEPVDAVSFLRAPRALYAFREESYVLALKTLEKTFHSVSPLKEVLRCVDEGPEAVVDAAFKVLSVATPQIPAEYYEKWLTQPRDPVIDVKASRTRRAAGHLLQYVGHDGCEYIVKRFPTLAPENQLEVLECLPAGHQNHQMRVLAAGMNADVKKAAELGRKMLDVPGLQLEPVTVVAYERQIEKIPAGSEKNSWLLALGRQLAAQTRDAIEAHFSSHLLWHAEFGVARVEAVKALLRVGESAQVQRIVAKDKKLQEMIRQAAAKETDASVRRTLESLVKEPAKK